MAADDDFGIGSGLKLQAAEQLHPPRVTNLAVGDGGLERQGGQVRLRESPPTRQAAWEGPLGRGLGLQQGRVRVLVARFSTTDAHGQFADKCQYLIKQQRFILALLVDILTFPCSKPNHSCVRYSHQLGQSHLLHSGKQPTASRKIARVSFGISVRNYAPVDGLNFLLAERELREFKREASVSNSPGRWVAKASAKTESTSRFILCLARLFSSWAFFL